MPNDDKNPLPNDIPKKSPPHEEAGKNWNWKPDDESLGVNPATKSEFDNENIWYEKGYTDEEGKRSYVGKHTDHKYPHISIHGKSGTLKAKDGYLYRLFNCTITELSAEGMAIVYCRDCKIDKLTGTAPEAKARFHFTNCEIKDVKDVTNYHMFFDRETKFKSPNGNSQFSNITDSSLIIYSKPEWKLTGKKHMENFTDCNIVVSGPSVIHNVGSAAMHSNLLNCNYVAMGQWLATGGKSGCTSESGPKVFDTLENCDFINLNTKINNPEVSAGMYMGMKECNVTNIMPNFVVHTGFFNGEKCNVSSVGGTYEDCDVIHFHIKESTACCVNTDIIGAPGAGSMLQVGVSDDSSLVVAGGKVDVEDNAAPVFAAKNCSMRFYDCEKVKQNGNPDLFANIENCITRVFFCEEVRSVHERVWNEKKNCRVDAVGNKAIKADDSDIGVMGENCVLKLKYNKECIAKLKIAHLKDNSSYYSERNGPMTSLEDKCILVENESHANIVKDKKYLSQSGEHIVQVKGRSRFKSLKTWYKGDASLYGLKIEDESIVELEYDKVESAVHVVKIDESKLFSKWQEFIAHEHLGIIGATSYIDIMEGYIQTVGEEFTLGQCQGTIKDVDLLGTKEIIFNGKNSFFIYDQLTKYIYMASEDKVECEKLEVLNDVLGADCIFKVRDGSILGQLSLASKEAWLHSLDVNGTTSIDADLCKVIGCNLKSTSITGGLLFIGGTTALTTALTSKLGLLSDSSFTSLSTSGVYIMSNINAASVSAKGLVFYDEVSGPQLSLPYKKGVYSSDNLDIYAEENIKLWAIAGDVWTQAGMNIKELAGMNIEEIAGVLASTKATIITHN